MKINPLLITGVVSLLVGSCISFQGANFYRSPAFKPNATFKVITLNSNDGVAGRIEHYLLTNKFRVISDHSLRLPGSTALPNLAAQLDSVRYSNNPLVVNIPYMEDKPSDYIIRYNFDNPSSGTDARSSLNILVANTQTGEAEISFLQEQKGRLEQPRLDRVIQDFIRRLRTQ